MKKTLVLLTLTAGLCFQAVAVETNRSLAFGAGFANFLERYPRDGGPLNSYLGSPRFNITAHNFIAGGNTGRFANAMLVAIPVFHSATNNFEGSALRFQTGLVRGFVMFGARPYISLGFGF